MAEESINDEVFGELKRENWSWIGKVEIAPGQAIEVSFYTDENDDLLFEQSRSIFKLLRQNETEYRQSIADRMLKLYNETWSEGEKIDCETFASRIRLSSITFSPDGAEAFYDDDDLFLGHWIAVVIDKDGVIKDSHLAG